MCGRQVTYKSKIQLTHCKEVEADEDAPEGDEGQQSPPAEGEAPVQGEEKATPPAPETPQETTEQKEAYQGQCCTARVTGHSVVERKWK